MRESRVVLSHCVQEVYIRMSLGAGAITPITFESASSMVHAGMPSVASNTCALTFMSCGGFSNHVDCSGRVAPVMAFSDRDTLLSSPRFRWHIFPCCSSFTT